MSHIDQLSELIQLWNSLNDAQREGVLRLLRVIIEEAPQVIVEKGENNGQKDCRKAGRPYMG